VETENMKNIKLDSDTLLSLCLINIGNDKLRVEKTALLSRAVALEMESAESAKTAFFGGLLYRDIKERVLPCPLFNKCDNIAKKCAEAKNYIDNFFKQCLSGNIFIAYCIGLKEALDREEYNLTAEEFLSSAPKEAAEKFFKVTTIVGTIVAICDCYTEDFLEGKLHEEDIREHLTMEFPDNAKVVDIAIKEARKMWGENTNIERMELI
jgi:hypothetical protein